MQLPGSRGQQERDWLYDSSGTIAVGGTPQLLLPEHKSRSFLFIQNMSASADMYVEFGGARATCAITNGQVTSFSITNAGFNYTYPPIVRLLGGGNSGNSAYLGVGAPGYPAPGDPAYVAARYQDMSTQKPARATAVLSGAAVNSITIDDPGAGYQVAPMVLLMNDLRDPFGVAIASATQGMWLPPGGSNTWVNGTFCPTAPVSIFSATGAARFCCKWAI